MLALAVLLIVLAVACDAAHLESAGQPTESLSGIATGSSDPGIGSGVFNIRDRHHSIGDSAPWPIPDIHRRWALSEAHVHRDRVYARRRRSEQEVSDI